VNSSTAVFFCLLLLGAAHLPTPFDTLCVLLLVYGGMLVLAGWVEGWKRWKTKLERLDKEP
jgi:hypothetical protein